MDLSSYRVDENKANNGTWFNLTRDSRVKVARMGNPKYKTTLIKRMKELVPAGLTLNENDPETEQAVIMAMAEDILLDWENVTIDGEDIDPTFENRLRVLQDFPDFLEVISTFSIDRSNFMPEGTAKK